MPALPDLVAPLRENSGALSMIVMPYVEYCSEGKN